MLVQGHGYYVHAVRTSQDVHTVNNISGVNPGGGAIATLPIKIYLGESIFSPLKVLAELQKLHQECTKNRHFKIQKQKKNFWGGGRAPKNIFGLTPLCTLSAKLWSS